MTIGAEIPFPITEINDAVIQIGTGPLTLHQIGGFSLATEVSDYYVMLFDDLTVNPGDSPFQTFNVPIGGTFSWEPALNGWKCAAGLSIALSTTPDIYTATTGATGFLFAQAIDQDP